MQERLYIAISEMKGCEHEAGLRLKKGEGSARWMQMLSLNNGVKCGENKKVLAVDEETIKRRSFHSAALQGERE